MESIIQDLDPRDSYSKWFSTNPNMRPDGRALSQTPEISFQLGIISSAEGSSMIKYGETVIVASVKSEVAEPEVSTPNEGFIVPNFHFVSGARGDVRPGPPSEEVQEITDKLAKILRSGLVIDSKKLNLIPGELCRVLYIDVVCLCDSGSVFEAALFACMMALKNAALYVPEFDASSGLVIIKDKLNRKKIELLSWPCSLTFGFFNGSIIFCSPDHQEQKACGSSKMCVVFDLLTNDLIEIEKNSINLTDSELFTKIGPIIASFSEKHRPLTLLD